MMANYKPRYFVIGLLAFVAVIFFFKYNANQSFLNSATTLENLLLCKNLFFSDSSTLAPVSKRTTFRAFEPNPRCGSFVRSFYENRLGNHLFMYAAFYGMVKKQAATANKVAFVRVRDLPSSMSDIFESLSIPEKILPDSWFDEKNFSHQSEVNCCAYDKTGLDQLACDGKNVIMEGNRQNFRYFEDVFEEIKNEFTFRKPIQEKCRQLFDDNLAKTGLSRENCTTVGVHLRRGDYTNANLQHFGHWPVQFDYLQKAVRYHEIYHLQNSTEIIDCLAFVIFGNDYEWNLDASKRVELLKPNISRMVVINADQSTPAIDMCALRLADHIIITSGTYGWWAGFYSRGLVTYQKEYARPGSLFYSQIVAEDFLLPHWIPL